MTGERRRVLGIFAHPDDAEIWAGGTLLAHHHAGDHTALCVLTHGDDDRADEARQGATALHAELHHLTFRDRALAGATGAVEAVARVLAEERPNIILTHWGQDSHPDHRATGEIASAAIMLAEVENDLTALFCCDTYNGAGLSGPFRPDCLVDVSATWETKTQAIMAHRSQDPEQYCAMIARQCAMHGAACGVRYAEGFVQVPFLGKGRRAHTTLWQCL